MAYFAEHDREVGFSKKMLILCVFFFKGGYIYVLIHKGSTMNGIESGVV